MFKLTNAWFYCIKTSDDGAKGIVTFTWCGGNYGVEDVEGDHNEFRITWPGKYYLSVSAYVQNYEGGVFQMRLKKKDNTDDIATIFSDHEDDGEGFTGGGNVYQDNIYYLSSGDVLDVDITHADKGSKLTTASISMFWL